MKGITEKLKSINFKELNLAEVISLARANNQVVKKAVFGILLVICLLLFVFGGNDEEIAVEASSGAPGDVVIETDEAGDLGASQADAAYATLPAGKIFVDVQGAVESPGVVRLTEGARVFQAIEAAGGVVSMGDTSLLNLAQQLNDGDKLYVPFTGETVTLPDGNQAIAGTGQASAVAAGGAGLVLGAGSGNSGSGKININTATSEELQTLSGIGIVTAGKIVDYRSKNGKFAKPEDIKNVSGIGDRTYDNIKDDICV